MTQYAILRNYFIYLPAKRGIVERYLIKARICVDREINNYCLAAAFLPAVGDFGYFIGSVFPDKFLWVDLRGFESGKNFDLFVEALRVMLIDISGLPVPARFRAKTVLSHSLHSIAY